MSTDVLRPGLGRNPVLCAASWIVKAVALVLALLVSQVIAGKLVPVDMPLPPPDGPLSLAQAFLVVNGLVGFSLSLVAATARVSGWRLGLLLFVCYFAISGVVMELDTIYLNNWIAILPLPVVGQILAQSAIMAAIAAVAGALLFHPAGEPAAPVPHHIARRVALLAIIYAALYFAAGLLIAFQSEIVRGYYHNGSGIPLFPTVAFQLFRGLLWALTALYLVTHLKGSLLVRATVMAILFAVMTDAQLLYPNPVLPWLVRRVHLVEVGTSEFAYGIIATLVLLAGAARRPLADRSRWRLLTGNA